MAKIYPDTMCFVHLYEKLEDKIDLFDKLRPHTGSLVLTEQTVTEFRRNRVQTLNWLLEQFKKTVDVPEPFMTAVLKASPAHQEYTKRRQACIDQAKEVRKYIKGILDDESRDPVAQNFHKLTTAVITFKLTDKAITRAHHRKLLGNPPSSPDKYTVGDEVIWELLLDNVMDDLIIITRDATYHNNVSLLSDEYQRHTGKKLLLVTETFEEAFEAIGQHAPKELIEAEKKEPLRPLIDWMPASNLPSSLFKKPRLDPGLMNALADANRNAAMWSDVIDRAIKSQAQFDGILDSAKEHAAKMAEIDTAASSAAAKLAAMLPPDIAAKKAAAELAKKLPPIPPVGDEGGRS